MKNMYRIMILLAFVTVSAVCCQDITVGYLMTANAAYTPDSLVVKAPLPTGR